jgi:chromosome partitioning protein
MSTIAIAIANQKGGVGKTGVTLGLASAASRKGLRTLVIDVDPQANSTTALGIEFDEVAVTISDVLARTKTGSLTSAIVSTAWVGVDVVPADLAAARVETDPALDVSYRLKDAMSGAVDAYDLVLIDCPPSVGRLLAVALTAADQALLVTDAAADGVRGIVNVLDTIDVVKRHMNPILTIAGIVVNRYRRTSEQDFREAELREAYGTLVLPGHLPERTALATAHAAAQPIHADTSDGGRTLAAAFVSLLTRVMNGA